MTALQPKSSNLPEQQQQTTDGNQQQPVVTAEQLIPGNENAATAQQIAAANQEKDENLKTQPEVANARREAKTPRKKEEAK